MNDNPIDKMRKYIDSKRDKAYVALRQCSVGVDSLKKNILDGLRSEDPVADFTTVCYGAWSDDVTGPYRELVRNVSENLGRDVLIVKCSVDGPNDFKMSTMCGIAPSPVSYTKKWNLQLGVVNGNVSFNNYDQSIMIPTKKHLTMSGDEFALDGNPDYIDSSDSVTSMNFMNKSWKIFDGPIIENVVELNLFQSLPVSTECRKTSRILFGDYVDYFFSCRRDGDILHLRGLELLSS
jgi:hypothetical protein